MSAEPDDQPPQARPLPASRLARSARIGGVVAEQGLRWAGMRTANHVRSPERAAAARSARTAALIGDLVEQLARMRGAAMKVGQMLSMIELDGIPEDQRADLARRLAALRDDVPPVPFAKLEKLLRGELGGPLSSVFSEFDERAFAAASIGQVHRARTVEGDDVAVKIQYPGVAEAVETDLRNAGLLVPLLGRLAPGLDARALVAEMRERVAAELDYELEAESQRRIERLMRGHPFVRVPRVHGALSTRRVLVSEYVPGIGFDEVCRAGQEQRDRYAEIVFRFFFGLAYRHRIALGDPHPGNYLLGADGRVCFLDFGLVRDIEADRLEQERAIARAVRDGDAMALKAALCAAGYLPAERAAAVDPDWALRMMRRASGWYAIPGRGRVTPAAPAEGEAPERDAADHARSRAQAHQLTLPPQALVLRRMHAVVAVVLRRLHARGDWGAIAAEYLHGAEPAGPFGRAQAAGGPATR